MSKRLPSITSDIPRDLRNFVDRLRELISGGGADKLLTTKDLSDAGVINVNLNGGITAAAATGTYYAAPPAPTNVTATGAINNIIVDWDEPAYKGHAYAEVWRSDTNNIGTALRVGMTPGSVFTDPVGPGVTKYYWVRYVNINDDIGPYNAVSGAAGTTGPAVDYLLTTLTNQITSSQLYSTLGSRIDLIDANSSVIGSVNNRIAVLQGQITDIAGTAAYSATTAYAVGNLVNYGGKLYRALQASTNILPTNTTYWDKIGDYTSLGQAVAANADNIETVVTDLTAEISARTLLDAQVNNATTGLPATRATLINDYYTKTDANSTIATAVTGLASTTYVTNALSNYTNTATLQANYYTKTDANTAISNATTSLVSTTTLNTALGNYTNTASLQANYYTKTSGTALEAQYTVKVDTNGYVSGFGLASTAINSAPTSNFAVRADNFYIANPSGPGVAPAIPFIVRTTSTTINGVTVPVGVYITDGFIQNGTITNAKIGNAAIDDAKIANLDAAKITTGFLSADRISSGSLDAKIASIGSAQIGNLDASKITTGSFSADRIDSRNLTIKAADGTVILGAGTTLNTPYITVGAATSVAAAGQVASAVYPNYLSGTTQYNYTDVVTTTTGTAPINIWVDMLVEVWSDNANITQFSGWARLYIDGQWATWPAGYAVTKDWRVAPTNIGLRYAVFHVSFLFRTTLAAGSHTFSTYVQATGSGDGYSGPQNWTTNYYGYGNIFSVTSAVLVMENKL